jgi:hypothetical protein
MTAKRIRVKFFPSLSQQTTLKDSFLPMYMDAPR